MKKALLLCCLLPVTSSCEDKAELQARQSLKEHYDPISANADPLLVNLEGIKKACQDLPTATEITNFTPPHSPLFRKYSERNLFYVHQSDLTQMVYRKAAPDLDNAQPWINITKQLADARSTLAAKEGSISYFPLKDAWKIFAKVEYLLVVRGGYIAPKLGAGDTFVPGVFKGDGQLFSLLTGQHLGGFPLEVASSGQIKVIYSNENKWSDIDSDLMKDLSKRLVLAIKASLETATGKTIE